MNTLARNLSHNQQWLIGGLLLLVMLVTRSHFVNHIQDASWAIFFLAGFYLRSYLSFPVFWLAAFAIDLAVIKSTGIDNFCFTQAYPFLIPAYAAMWLAGRWFAAKNKSASWRDAAYLVGTAVVGVVLCDLISSGGFYWFSGHFAEPTLAVFMERLVKYTPLYLQTTLFYLAIATVIHLAVVQAGKLSGRTQT